MAADKVEVSVLIVRIENEKNAVDKVAAQLVIAEENLRVT